MIPRYITLLKIKFTLSIITHHHIFGWLFLLTVTCNLDTGWIRAPLHYSYSTPLHSNFPATPQSQSLNPSPGDGYSRQPGNIRTYILAHAHAHIEYRTCDSSLLDPGLISNREPGGSAPRAITRRCEFPPGLGPVEPSFRPRDCFHPHVCWGLGFNYSRSFEKNKTKVSLQS